MPHTEPTVVTCIKTLRLDNGQEFQAGETYDAFTVRSADIRYRVGKNRVGLSGLTPEQFNEHFEGLLTRQADKQPLFD